MMKIATWNVNSLKVRLPQVLTWLEENAVDVLALQELKIAPELFPENDFKKIGYYALWNSQKTYNGVALISKEKSRDIFFDNYFFPDEQKRIITATIHQIRIINVYCVNGEKIDSNKYIYKRKWFNGLIQYVQHELELHKNLIILGDFNIAPNDLDVYDPQVWHEKILCSSEERGWFNQLLNLGLKDSLREFDSISKLYTWWDYRLNGFKRNLGMRIDHILLTNQLYEKMQSFEIDKKMRELSRPSDHAPVVINLE